MKSLKALVISSCPIFIERAAQMIRRTLTSGSVFSCSGDGSLDAMCRIQPSLIVIDTAEATIDSQQLAQRIWSIEPDVRIVFNLDSQDKDFIGKVQEILPDKAVYALVFDTPESQEKLRVAIQAVSVFANNYCDASLRPTAASAAGRPVIYQRQDSHTSIALTDAERETLGDLLLGLTDKAIASKRHLSVRGVQSRLDRLAKKLCRNERRCPSNRAESYNLRARMIFQALKRGVFSLEEVIAMENVG